MKARLILVLLIALYPFLMQAQVPVVAPDLSAKTGIAPAFFGPNTFPVPLMNEARIADCILGELAGDFFDGFIVEGARDRTVDVFAKFSMPFIKDRVGLTLWMPAVEWWDYDDAVMAARRIQKRSSERYGSGDVYVSLDLGLVTENRHRPSVVVRSVLKTAAASNSFGDARNYDAAGYFFDLTVGKSFFESRDRFFNELRLAASTGFLCWQTDNGRQNDAVMYGAQAVARTRLISVDAQFSGYVGWEKFGDAPMVVSSTLTANVSRSVRPFFRFRYGLDDWPFAHYSLGVSVAVR